VVALGVPGCGTDSTPFLAGWKELQRGSILLLGMFLKYSLPSRKLNETSSIMDLQGCLFWPNLSMSDGFKGKLRVSSLAVGYYQFFVKY
jgi:hypothetical protein